MAGKEETRVLLILAAHAFDDHQYTKLKEALEARGAVVEVASTVTKDARGLHGLRVNPDMLVDDVEAAKYDAVVLVGGHGSSQYWHDVYVHDIVLDVYRRGGLVAAIDRAPVTLGEAGILKKHRATSSVSVYEKMAIFSSEFTAEEVTLDQNVLTAQGNRALDAFVKAVVEWLAGNAKKEMTAQAQTA